jgi:CDP-diacylglycerol--glycerol-3-phosphate 3-phosphatidyltransferase
MNIANIITILRVLLIIPVLVLASSDPSFYNWIALILFVIAGITDHLDGYIARKTNSTSDLGALLDLVADKLLIIIVLFYLISYASELSLIIPSLIIIFREIVISSFRQLLAEKNGRNPVKVSFIAKSKTTIQIFALSFLIISPNFGEPFFYLTTFLFWLAAYVSLHSLYGYIKNYRNLIK